MTLSEEEKLRTSIKLSDELLARLCREWRLPFEVELDAPGGKGTVLVYRFPYETLKRASEIYGRGLD